MRLVCAVTILGRPLDRDLASLFGTFSIQDLFHWVASTLNQQGLKLKTETFIFSFADKDDAETTQDPLLSAALCCSFSHMAFASISTRSFEVTLVKMRRADEDSFCHLRFISQHPFLGIHHENVSAQILFRIFTHTYAQVSFSRSQNGKGMTSWWIPIWSFLKWSFTSPEVARSGGEEDAEASSCWGCSAGRWVCAESSPDALWGWSWKALTAGSVGRWEEQPGATSSRQDRWPSPGGAERRWEASV